ncbi:isomerase [Saccharopolyspora griseoalba]|uniref:Isomerase n=1 Tax=Saccharopolyspora griseoalba TaxID=1431848 RepID=A0ABW2LK04_9PSEU
MTRAPDRLQQYVRFWNTGAEEQRALADEVFAEGVEYRALFGTRTGAQALMDFREELVAHVGEVSLRLREQPQVNDRHARLKWQILTDADAPFATGTDVIELDQDDRIRAVTVFLDQPPEGFEAEHDA